MLLLVRFLPLFLSSVFGFTPLKLSLFIFFCFWMHQNWVSPLSFVKIQFGEAIMRGKFNCIVILIV